MRYFFGFKCVLKLFSSPVSRHWACPREEYYNRGEIKYHASAGNTENVGICDIPRRNISSANTKITFAPSKKG